MTRCAGPTKAVQENRENKLYSPVFNTITTRISVFSLHEACKEITVGGGRHLEFSLSFIACLLLLRIFARNFARGLILWSYVRIDYIIEQK